MSTLHSIIGGVIAVFSFILLIFQYGKKSQQNTDNKEELNAIVQHQKNDKEVDTLTDAEQLEYARTGVLPKG